MKMYLCGEAWDLEVGNAPSTYLYSSVAALKADHDVPECGIVEVDVQFSKWIELRTKIKTNPDADWTR